MIIGFSGKKQSGKSSCSKWIVAAFLKYANLISGGGVTEGGDLFVERPLADGTALKETLELQSDHELLVAISPFVRVFGIADELKRISVNLFGISPESIYGTEEQ